MRMISRTACLIRLMEAKAADSIFPENSVDNLAPFQGLEIPVQGYPVYRPKPRALGKVSVRKGPLLG